MNIQQTSLQAYDALDNLGERQKSVFQTISSFRECTNAMIAYRLGVPINCITPRTNELVKLDMVVKSYIDNCPITKHRAIYWKINDTAKL